MKKLVFRLPLFILLSAGFLSPDISHHQTPVHQVDCSEAALREAISAGGTLELAVDCTYTLTRNLPHIGGDITIHGNNATIDGAGGYRLLSTVYATGVTLDNLTLQNGAYGEGGALYVPDGNVAITNSAFIDNTALFGSGGAVWLKRGTLTVAGSTFTGNSADHHGGGVYFEDGTATISDSVFSGNVAAAGGGIFVEGGTTTIHHSVFSGNSAGDGGGLYAETQDATIDNSTFTGNAATAGNGGGVYAGMGDLLIISSTITNNAADDGGGVYWQEGTLHLRQSIIAGNSADARMPDVPLDSSFDSLGYNLVGYDNGGRLDIVATDIVNLDPGLGAFSDGVVVLLAGSPALDAVPPSECATGTDQRGVERPQGAGCDIGAVEVRQTGAATLPTPAPTAEAAAPGEIACTEAALHEAILAGGEFDLPGDCSIVLTRDLPEVTRDITIRGNGATIDGDHTYRMLHAPGFAGVIIDNLTLRYGQGGGVWAARGTVTITGSTLAGDLGGGVYAGSGNVTVTGSAFMYNLAERGGAIYAYNGDISIADSVFIDNASALDGGAVWAAEGTVTITHTEFTGNRTGNGSGGGVFVESGTVIIEDSAFTGNLADQRENNGGGIAVNSADVTITRSTFTHNSSGGGGAVYSAQGTIGIQESSFTGNLAFVGGDVHRGGGALFADDGELSVEHSAFYGNASNSEGGAVYSDYGDVSVAHNVFSGNSSKGSGGAVSVFEAMVTITNSTFTNNVAKTDDGWGGALLFWGDAIITSSTFVGNSAEEAGAIFAWGPLTLTQSIVAGNTATSKPDMDVHLFASLNSGGYNLIGYGYGFDFAPTDIVAEEPGLDDFNGDIHPLAAGSPALDAIPLEACATDTDQRGVPRPQGEGCDIGAVEMAYTAGGALEVVPAGEAEAVEPTAVSAECNEDSLHDALRTGGVVELAAGCVYTLTRDLPLITFDLAVNGNGATIDGGGAHRLFYAPGLADITLNNLTVQNGYSETDGGGVYAREGDVSITDCTLYGNAAAEDGGGVVAGGHVAVVNSAFIENAAGDQGGGIWATNTEVTITNSTFTGNSAASGGGVSISSYDGVANIAGSTFVNNSAGVGGGLYAWYGALNVQQSIVMGNNAETGPDISFQYGNGFTSLGYNLIGEDPELRFDPTDLTASDPGLDAFTGAYYPLLADSPAVDAVPLAVCITDTDQRGVSRPQGAGCDIGAVEMEQTGDFVPPTPAPTPTPTAPVQVACTEDALREAVRAGGEFELPPDCHITLTSDLPEIGANLTLHGNGAVIDGVGEHRLFYATGFIDVTLENLTVQNGYGETGGGGVRTDGGYITIVGCVFRGNVAAGEDGGALYTYNGDVNITESTFTDNAATDEYGSGGGVEATVGDVTITDSIFSGNSATIGGGLNVWDGTVTITRSTFSGNSAALRGGGVSSGSGDVNIVDSVFSGNETTGSFECYGGGVYSDSGLTTITGSLFVENAATNGGGLSVDWGGAIVINSTFYGNRARGTTEPSVSTGGAIGAHDGPLTIIASTVAGNSSEGFSGGVDMSFSTLAIRQSIIADNEASTYPNILSWNGTFVSEGYNLLGSNQGALPLDETDILTGDSGLGAFDEDLGIVPSDINSPALDAVPPETCATDTDQRGVSRPQGEGCDIGAAEME